MQKYSTRQRRILLSYLSEHVDEQLTAKQLASDLENKRVSLSAVYRNLAELEAEGKVRRSSKGGSREIFYQYTDAECCRNCLHLSCTKCGKTFHMDTAEAALLIDRVVKKEQFTIDKTGTVLYGVCKDCKSTF